MGLRARISWSTLAWQANVRGLVPVSLPGHRAQRLVGGVMPQLDSSPGGLVRASPLRRTRPRSCPKKESRAAPGSASRAAGPSWQRCPWDAEAAACDRRLPPHSPSPRPSRRARGRRRQRKDWPFPVRGSRSQRPTNRVVQALPRGRMTAGASRSLGICLGLAEQPAWRQAPRRAPSSMRRCPLW